MDINEMKKCNMMELQQIHRLKEEGKSIIFVNGCFDLFHVGHLSLLEFAKTQGDVLVVGVNSDQSIKQIKGVIDNVDRPIIDEDSRLRIIKALKCVDFAILFDENHPGCLINVIKWRILKDGYFDISVSGNCMVPLIYDGDPVRIYPLGSKLEIGDIVLLFSDGKYRLHRVVRLKNNEVLTKGDNAAQVDGNTDQSNILGQYSGKNKFKKIIAKLSLIESKSDFLLVGWIAGLIKNLFQVISLHSL